MALLKEEEAKELETAKELQENIKCLAKQIISLSSKYIKDNKLPEELVDTVILSGILNAYTILSASVNTTPADILCNVNQAYTKELEFKGVIQPGDNYFCQNILSQFPIKREEFACLLVWNSLTERLYLTGEGKEINAAQIGRILDVAKSITLDQQEKPEEEEERLLN